MSFIDQMLDRLAGKGWYFLLDGYSGYNKIFVAPEDQVNTTFTFLYGTITFKQMPFGLYNTQEAFYHRMMSTFYDMADETTQLFMEDLCVLGDSFDGCLDHLA